MSGGTGAQTICGEPPQCCDWINLTFFIMIIRHTSATTTRELRKSNPPILQGSWHIWNHTTNSQDYWEERKHRLDVMPLLGSKVGDLGIGRFTDY